MIQKTLSFVVPAYNVEPYIETCLDSFLCGEVLDQIEVIVVNDGSSDRTAEIVEGYVKKWPEVFRLHSQENGGHGAALNTGITLVTGKYFKVIDSDDWVIAANIPPLISRLAVCTADIILTPYHQIDMTTGEITICEMFAEEYERSYSLQEIVNNWKAFEQCFTLHGISYRTDFYKKYAHRLPGKIFYEDQEYATIPCVHAETIYPIDIPLYQYRVGNPQQSISAEKRIERIGHIEKVTMNLLDYYTQHPDLSQYAKVFLLKKAEVVALSYYVTGCIQDPDKKRGRRNCRHFTEKIVETTPELYQQIRKKIKVFFWLNRLHVNESRYRQIIQSALYRSLRHKYKTEQEG